MAASPNNGVIHACVRGWRAPENQMMKSKLPGKQPSKLIRGLA